MCVWGGACVEHEQTTQKGQGHRDSEEMLKTYPESRNTEDLQEGLWAKACTDDHKSDGWMDNPQTISTKAKADMSLPLRVGITHLFMQFLYS